MMRSTKSYSVRLSSWNSHVARFIALLSLQVLTCMLFTTLSMDQEVLGEPWVRPRARAPKMRTHPAFVESSGRATPLLNHWQPLQMREHNLRTTSKGKPQVYMRWIEPHAWSPVRKQGQPGKAPNQIHHFQRENVFEALLEENMKLVGQLDMEGDGKPGPQEKWLDNKHRNKNMRAVQISYIAGPLIKCHLSILRYREPAKAPNQKDTDRGAPIPQEASHHGPNIWQTLFWSGTWIASAKDCAGKRPARTAVSACIKSEHSVTVSTSRHERHDFLAKPARRSAKQLWLLQTAGLTREEPLRAKPTKGCARRHHQSLQSCPIPYTSKSSRIEDGKLWTHFPDPSKLYQPPNLRPAMADAETAEQPQAEGQEEGNARPKRFPRSRVRADGARRRTQTELDNRRQAKKDGAGFWATPAGKKVLAGQPQNGPVDERSHGRPYHGPSQARSSSRTSRGSGQRQGEWPTHGGYHHGGSSSWRDREDDTWWQSEWWSSSNWNERQWTRVRPAEPAEDKQESPQEEARRLMKEITQKNQEATSHKSSAGSTETVPKTNQDQKAAEAPTPAGLTETVPKAQDKRAAELATPGEPSKRNRPPPQPIATITKKWREWLRLQELLTSLREAGAPELLSERVAQGHYNDKHGSFHQHPGCKAIPRAGNWILAQAGVLLVRGVCGTATNSSTYGTTVETWLYKVSQVPDFTPILEKMAETIATLQSLMEGIPTMMHDQVRWAGTESQLQTLLQEFFPLPDTAIAELMNEHKQSSTGELENKEEDHNMEPAENKAVEHEQQREPKSALKTEDPLFSPSSMSECQDGESPLGPPAEEPTKPVLAREPALAPEPASSSTSAMPPPSLVLEPLDRKQKEELLDESPDKRIKRRSDETNQRREAPTRTRAYSTMVDRARPNNSERFNRTTASMSVRRNRSRPVSPDRRTYLSHDRRKRQGSHSESTEPG